jgi:hypothetical protein
MAKNPLKLPSKEVLQALFKKKLETDEKVAALRGEYGDRVKHQQDNGNLHKVGYDTYTKLMGIFRDNEFKAREVADIIEVYIDFAREEMDKNGHVGDLAKQAQEAEDGDERPDNTPKGSKPKAGPKGKREKAVKEAANFVQEQRAANDEGDKEIRETAARLNGGSEEPNLPEDPAPPPSGRKPATGRGSYRNLQ